MMTKLAAKLGLPLFVLGLAVAPAMAQTAPAAPAPAAKAAPAKAAKAAKPAAKVESATDKLNAQSLSAAQAGKEFNPAAAAPAAAPAKAAKKAK